MKNILGLALIAGLFTITSCGPSAEEQAEAQRKIDDSTAAAQAQMMAAEEAAREQAIQDSIAAAANMMADSVANTVPAR